MVAPALSEEGKIKCELDGQMVHSVAIHLKRNYPDVTLDEYKLKWPEAPLISEQARKLVLQQQKLKLEEQKMSDGIEMRPMAEVFGLGVSPAAMSKAGKPVMTPYFKNATEEFRYLIPEIDPNYIFDVETVKSLLIAQHMKANVYLWGYHGTGKCLGKGTSVLMFNGSTKSVEDVKPGDLVMGPDSFPRRVTSITSGRETMYEIEPTKGDSYIVNESHILSLRKAGNGGAGEIVNISVKDYLAKSESWKSHVMGWRAGVDWLPQVDGLPIEPYFVGVWLGDGNSRDSVVWSIDEEIVLYLTEYADKLGLKVAINNPMKKEAGVVGYSICGDNETRGTRHHPLREGLRKFGMLGNKHIPHVYKTASREERLQLLAGVIDTDGALSCGGYDLTLKSERLMDDVIFVARSLGFAAYKKECEKTATQTAATERYFRCHISGDVSQIPVRIARKKAPARRQEKSVLNVGITVKSLGEGDYYGFSLEGPDRLFLLGDFTVTHNTSALEQFAARQNKPFLRIQHSLNMEESHVTGGYEVKGGETMFNPGPLAVAMMHGLTYCADEYDRAAPQVISVYQAVLEGKPLYIKEAPPEMRRIVPHPQFQFVATGNTNGCGDETGLYQGTSMQDSANYSRFAVTLQVDYMEPKLETSVVAAQSSVATKDAEKLVKFAGQIREQFKASKLSATISPRELIHAAKYASYKAGQWREGLQVAWGNRLSRTDRETADQFAQRIFGEKAA